MESDLLFALLELGIKTKIRRCEGEVVNNTALEMIPPEIIELIATFLGPNKVVMRLVCKKWGSSITSKCLQRSHCSFIVGELAKCFQTNSVPDLFTVELCNSYKLNHYWPYVLLPFDSLLTEKLEETKWVYLLDSHYDALGMPRIFFRDNMYAFYLLSKIQENQIFLREKLIPLVEKYLTSICGRTPNFALKMIRKKPITKLYYKIMYKKEKHTLSAVGKDRKECLLNFYGVLMAFIIKNYADYNEITKELAKNFPYNWKRNLSHLINSLPVDEDRKRYKIVVISSGRGNGYSYAKVSIGGWQVQGVGNKVKEAVQQACKTIKLSWEDYVDGDTSKESKRKWKEFWDMHMVLQEMQLSYWTKIVEDNANVTKINCSSI